jgi:hypothetical protein
MTMVAERASLPDRLDEELRLARSPMPDLFSDVVETTCRRLPVLKESSLVARFKRLIEAGAWTDAAIALVELEIPDWKVRRVVCEGGEWVCSLSRQSNLPMALDDTVDASHQTLPLAILRAFVEARRGSAVAPLAIFTVPPVQPASEPWICCDNFS